ncbi:hypothetical protein BP5796_08600 [Coleophoma crateriformis]|uniref:PLD phosphodiesterase domain-containing protein n=1 Tax=Coleophoma crateriformis TaxID=565419 RepID=A0A3D8R823_9HELO|nr:hypothetical protein BP5796_08600 [Coleophoma crateriformis]
MSDSENDEDLKRAIALSLQDSPAEAIVDLVSSEDEDDDLDAPVIARRNQKLSDSQNPGKVIEAPSPLANQMPSAKKEPLSSSLATGQAASSGLQSLDRKAMEAARLARNALKRKEPSSASSPSAESKVKRVAVVSSSRPSLEPMSKTGASSANDLSSQPSIPSKRHIAVDGTTNIMSRNDQQRLGAPGVQFPNGVVKRTWAYGYPRTDDIKIEEVLQKNDLQLAVLSSFQIDSDWIMNKLNHDTKVIWILQAKDEAEGEAGGIMENTVFLIDLPRLPNGKETYEKDITPFGRELLYFLTTLGLDQGTINSIKRFDFSRTADIAFVHSAGGIHADFKREGYCGLGLAVRELGLTTDRPLKIDFLASSLGSLNDSFIRCLYLAAQGDDGLKEFASRNKGKKAASSESLSGKDITTNFRIYFPTKNTVVNSKGGRHSGGTICLQRKWYEAATFPRSLLVDCKGKRPGILIHSKIMFVRGGPRPWAYIGSANCSESAWGKLTKDKMSSGPKHINCRNWECGVILPVGSKFTAIPNHGGAVSLALQQHEGEQGFPSMDIFDGNIPVPMEVPGETYGAQEPWYYNEN